MELGDISHGHFLCAVELFQMFFGELRDNPSLPGPLLFESDGGLLPNGGLIKAAGFSDHEFVITIRAVAFGLMRLVFCTTLTNDQGLHGLLGIKDGGLKRSAAVRLEVFGGY